MRWCGTWRARFSWTTRSCTSIPWRMGWSRAWKSAMPNPSPVEVVQAWQEAANRRDIEQVLQLSKADIEIVGPRGSGFGHDLLRQWFDHARVELEPLRVFARGAVVV